MIVMNVVLNCLLVGYKMRIFSANYCRLLDDGMLTHVRYCIASSGSNDMARCDGLQRNMQKLPEGLYV